MFTEGIAMSQEVTPFCIHYYEWIQMSKHLLNAYCVLFLFLGTGLSQYEWMPAMGANSGEDYGIWWPYQEMESLRVAKPAWIDYKVILAQSCDFQSQTNNRRFKGVNAGSKMRSNTRKKKPGERGTSQETKQNQGEMVKDSSHE